MGNNLFVNGFVSASLTVSIGAMAVIGSIQDGIYGDHSTLIAKAILDFIIIMIMGTIILPTFPKATYLQSGMPTAVKKNNCSRLSHRNT